MTEGRARPRRANVRDDAAIRLIPKESDFSNTEITLVYVVEEFVPLCPELEAVTTGQAADQVVHICVNRLANRNILNGLGDVRDAVETGSTRIGRRDARRAASTNAANARHGWH